MEDKVPSKQWLRDIEEQTKLLKSEASVFISDISSVNNIDYDTIRVKKGPVKL